MADAQNSADVIEAPAESSTPQEQQAPSQTISESHDVKPAEADTQVQSEAKTEEPHVDENKRRAENKMSKLESELNQANRNAELNQKWILEKEDRTKEYLRSSGYNDERIEQAVAEIRQQYPEIWSQKNKKGDKAQDTEQAPRQQPVTFDQVRQVTRDEMMLSNAHQGFFTAIPELSPDIVRALPKEEREEKAIIADAVERLAVNEARKQGMRVPTSDMYVKAYGAIRPTEAINEAKQEGQLEGMAQANATNASTFGARSGSQQATNVNLTPQEMDMAKRMNISPEEYAKHKT